jgi:hypothetical protein
MNHDPDVWMSISKDRTRQILDEARAAQALRRSRPGERMWLARQVGHVLRIAGERLQVVGKQIESPEMVPCEMETVS